MSVVDVITSILSLIAGVGVFLIACTMMSSNLESLSSKKLKKLFEKTSKNKLVGVGVGAVTTTLIQSSSATTVMVIGFVNAGIMSLAQAAAMIFGANIGTTITGQLVSLGLFGNSISVSIIFASLAGIGAFILAFAKKDIIRKIGGILAGFGMIFVGLSLMSQAMDSFAASPSLKDFLASINHPLLLVLIGILLTALVQSSSVMTSIAITMVVTGLITLDQGIYITMGSNVGTCITALIAGLTSGRNAKRTALIHVIFNVSGVLLFLLIGLFLNLGGHQFGTIFEKMFPNAPQTQLAMFHTVFNLLTTLLTLPLTNYLVKIVTKIIPDKKTDLKNEPHFHFIDQHMLKTPPLAVQQVKNEIIHMASIAIDNFNASCNLICSLDYKDLDNMKEKEAELNYLNKEIGQYIVKLLKERLSEKDRVFLFTAVRSISDLERIGDYSMHIIDFADHLKDENVSFSSDAIEDITKLQDLIKDLYENVIKSYKDVDQNALKKVMKIEIDIHRLTEEMANNHVRRLSEDKCTPNAGAQYLSLSTSAERIAHHFYNIAKTIKE